MVKINFILSFLLFNVAYRKLEIKRVAAISVGQC